MRISSHTSRQRGAFRCYFGRAYYLKSYYLKNPASSWDSSYTSELSDDWITDLSCWESVSKRPDPVDLNGSWVGAQLPWSVGDVVLGRSSSGSSNLRSDLDSISVRSGSDPPWRVLRKQSVAAFVSLNFPIEIFRSMMLKANRGFAGDFFSFGFWLQQAWWLRVPPVDLEFSNSSVLQKHGLFTSGDVRRLEWTPLGESRTRNLPSLLRLLALPESGDEIKRRTTGI
ncbi:hypothetical protein Bca4012_080833 [Brassica carinata]